MLELWFRRTLIAVTALGAVVASFIFLTGLALQTGWPAPAAPLLPLCVDALAAMALTQYRATGQKTAARVAVAAIVLSAVGNSASHWFSTGLLEPGWLAITLVGAVPAVALGVSVHLITSRGSEWKDDKTAAGSASSSAVSSSGTSKPNSRPVTRATGSASAASRTAGSKKAKPRRTDEQLLALIEANGWQELSGTKLTSALNVQKARALKLRKILDAQKAAPAASNGQYTDQLSKLPEKTLVHS